MYRENSKEDKNMKVDSFILKIIIKNIIWIVAIISACVLIYKILGYCYEYDIKHPKQKCISSFQIINEINKQANCMPEAKMKTENLSIGVGIHCVCK